jgi:DUF438 domain-containing protein
VPPQEVKEKFRQVLESVSSLEIAKIEQELVKEGISREEIQRLCDVHLAIFKEQLEKQQVEAAPQNPVNILRGEHEALQKLLEKLATLVDKVQRAENLSSISGEIQELSQVSADFLDTEKHYLREENVLFPLLEKHGITEPPAIMWMEHNQLREKKKQLHSLIANHEKISFKEFQNQLAEAVGSLNDILSNHIFKENNILFPAALRVVTEQEWHNARREFDEIGYCCFTPTRLIEKPEGATVQESKAKELITSEGVLQFETGSLSKDEVEAILNTLPVDITFVDKDDAVKYFSKGEKRIFTRTKAIIGRKVQLCHPQKSVHIVNRILEAFKKGEKNMAEFWIQVSGRLIHIRYFAVRDKNSKYLGTLEVSQDLTDLKKIEGEKRLLDWEG